MGKNFWPVFIIVAAVSLAATWRFAPVVGEKMPAANREKIRDAVAACLNHATASADAAQPAAPTSDVKPLGAPAPAAAAPKPAAPVAAAQKPAAARPAAPAPAVEEDDELPSLKGIMQVDASSATWGVLNQSTTVMGLDGEERGRVPGGRIFLIESRERVAKGYVLTGNFYPTPMAEPVRVPAMNLYCFTGKPESLSKHQRECLRNYYQLRGEAIDFKNKLLRENAERSPYGRDAAAAKKAFDAKAKEVEEASSGADPKAKNELSQLHETYLSLLQKHREWKAQHAAELPDPDKNPEYLKKLQASRPYAAPIAGMAL